MTTTATGALPPTPPVLVRRTPEAGERLAPDGIFEFVFDREMDPASAEALSFDPDLRGAASWPDARTLRFTPAQPLPRDAEYIASFGVGARAADGGEFAEPLTMRFVTQRWLGVGQTIPASGTTGVASDATITVLFDRPVVSLTLLEGAAKLPNPLRFEPPLAGKVEWLNTSALVFRPSKPLAGGVEYSAILSKKLTAVDGAPLQSDFRWTFRTALPRVVSTAPHSDERQRVRVDAPIVVRFDQPVDAKSAIAAFSLTVGRTKIAGRAVVTGDTLAFTPTKKLAFGTSFTARVAPGVVGVAGGAPTTDEASWRFDTAPLPKLVGISPRDGERKVDSRSSVTLKFNADIDPDSVMSQVHITPIVSPTSIYTWYNSYDHSFSINFAMRPDTDYLVRVDAGIRDPYGNPTPSGMHAKFHTSDLAPWMRPYLTRGASLFDARRPVRVAVETINIDHIDVVLYRLNDAPADLLPSYGNVEIPADWQPVLAFRRDVSATHNESARTVVTLGKSAEERLPAGAYVLSLKSQQLPAEQKFLYYLYVSDVNLVMKSEPSEVLLWATDLGTGAPIADLDLEVYQRTNDLVQPFGSAATDADGVARVRREASTPNGGYVSEVFALARGPRFAIVSSNWNAGIRSVNDPRWESSGYFGAVRAHLYTDRAIYRSGQQVYWRGVARAQDDFRYDLPVDVRVQVRLLDAQRNVAYSYDAKVDAFGTFSDALTLAADAAPGTYYLEARIDDARGGNLGSASSTFVVAEYRPPDFEVTVPTTRSEMLRTDAVRTVARAAYLSGSSLRDAALTWNIVAHAYDFRPPQLDRYTFRDVDDPWRCYDCWWFQPQELAAPIASGDGRTDANGEFVIEQPLPAEIRDSQGALVSGPLALSVEANVTGADNQVMSGRTTIVAHPADIYVGVAASARIVAAGNKMSADFVTVDWQGRRVAKRRVQVTIARREWENRVLDGGRTEYVQVDRDASTFELTTDELGAVQYEFALPQGGTYKLTATTLDDGGREARASVEIWASGPGALLWRRDQGIAVDMLSDKTTYAPGEVARILIPSPFIDEQHSVHYALVTVERAHVMRHEVLTITSASTVYELPIEDSYAPSVHVAVVLMNAPKTGANEFAQQRIGQLDLRVDVRKRLMQLTLTPDAVRAQPGETVGFTLRATDVDGKPVAGLFSVDMVDKGILNLKPRVADAIVHAFYDPNYLRLSTASALMISAQRVIDENELWDGEGRGGGGGDAFGAEAPMPAAAPRMAGEAPASGPSVREQFADTAYWRADVVTDRSGAARFEVKLPDNLTQWVLRAVGVDVETRVGEVLTNVTAALPLMIRPVTPRFFTVDDVAVLGAIVQNTTADAVTAQMSLRAAGVAIDGPAEIVTTIPAESETLVTWTVRALDVAQADLLFSVTSERYADAARPRLATAPNGGLRIERYSAPEAVGAAGELSGEEARSEVVVLPKEADAARSALELRIDASLASAMREGLGYLEHYPYECIEQIVSRFVPNVLTYRALDKLGIDDAELAAKLPPQVATAVAKLKAFQNEDGGWGWWPRRSSEANVSAWAVYGLLQARDAGFDVPPDMLQRGLNYLDAQQRALSMRSELRQLNWQAWLQYVLAEADSSDQSRIAELFRLRANLDHYGRAMLILAMGRRDAKDPRIATLFSDLSSKAVQSATGAHWEEAHVDWWAMNTDVRTTALVLTALARFDPQNALAPNVVRWLMQARTAGSGYWRTTQETAWSLIALTDWMRSSGELAASYGYAVRLGDVQIVDGMMSTANITRTTLITVPGAQMTGDAATRVTLLKRAGDGRLYYTAQLKAMLPASQVRAVDRGIVVQRRYVRADCVDGARCPSVAEAKVGDVLRVELTIIAPSDLTYLQLEDPLPAGAEAIDAALATASQLDREPALGQSGERRWWWWWNWWSRSELRDDRVSLFADWLARGTYTYSYTMRITTAGQFSVRPTYASLQYFPEVFGRGEGMVLRVDGRPPTDEDRK